MSSVPNGFSNARRDLSEDWKQRLLGELRTLLEVRARHGDQDSRALDKLVVEIVEDLIDAALSDGWQDVGAVEVSATEGAWRAALRLTRDANLEDYVCARGRGPRWR